MRWIVQTSLRFRYLVVFLAAALMTSGIARLSNSSVDVFPEFAPPKVEIQTISLGLSPASVEELVTVPLENALPRTPMQYSSWLLTSLSATETRSSTRCCPSPSNQMIYSPFRNWSLLKDTPLNFLLITCSASFILPNIKKVPWLFHFKKPMLLYLFPENNVIDDFTWELLILRK